MGLGGSSALAVSIIRALDRAYALDLKDGTINALAYQCEKAAHGTPSGIDNTIATYGMPLVYERPFFIDEPAEPVEPRFAEVKLAEPVPLVVGITGNAGQANYSASKAGVIGFTKTAAKELASRGVLVNAVAPGFIDTDMTKALPESARETLLKLIPLSRLGSADDVARAVLFLSSDLASYITGQVVVVDGGMIM